MAWLRLESLKNLLSPKAVLLGMAAVAFIVGTAWHWHASRQVALAAETLAILESQLSSVGAGTKARSVDYALRLPTQPSVDPVLSHIQRSSAEVSVAYLSVSLTTHAPTVQTLGRTDLSITLRGNYPNIKIVVAEALDRFPNLTLRRMVLRRLASPSELEARLELIQVARPLVAAGLGG